MAVSRLASPFFNRSIHLSLRCVPLPLVHPTSIRRVEGEDEEGGPIIAPSSSSAPDQFAVFTSSSSPPSVGGERRARAWPHLPHSSSPEDTAEFEVTATNLGGRERWRDAYDFHLRIQLCRFQGIQKCFGITCDTYLHR